MLRGARALTALRSIASTDNAPKLAGRAVSAGRAVAALVAMSGGAAADELGVPDRNRPKREWPDSPVKNFLEGPEAAGQRQASRARFDRAVVLRRGRYCADAIPSSARRRGLSPRP